MALRLEVKYKIPDARAGVKLKTWQELDLSGQIKRVELSDVYTIDAKLKAKDMEPAAGLLHNHVFQSYSWQKPLPPKTFDWAVEVAFLPGVTDNVAMTARETLADGLKYRFKQGEGVYTSQIFYLKGKISEIDAQKIVDSLYNPLIQSARIKDAKKFRREKGMGISVPKVVLKSSGRVNEINLWVSDAELVKLGQEGIVNPNGTRRGPLALDLDTLKAIRTYFHNLGRNPSDVELETLAQTWSEHCKHTIFADPLDNLTRGVFKTYIQAATEKIRKDKGKNPARNASRGSASGAGGDFCVSVFKDNSGGIKFGEDYVVTHKVETHNSPSALDPFGGAITGIVGVNRDTLGFGLGAKPVANIYGFCFSEPDDKRIFFRDAERTQPLLSSRRIMEGVVRGVNVGGNCSGIPTPQGFMCFDSRFRGKPLVFVGTVGLIPRREGRRDLCEKRARPGDYIVVIGGRVGLDGIHGATFSSVGLDKNSPATAVQIGDPITQKKLSDAVVKEARTLNLYHSITDNGAGGLSSSVGEMSRESGGCGVDLHKVPLKYTGLAPWQIWISESQERMSLAVPKNKWPIFSQLMKRRGVEASIIGEFTNSGRCVVRHGRKTVVDLPLEFLHSGRPIKYQESTPVLVQKNNLIPRPKSLEKIALQMLARPNIADHSFISEQYDHEVQGGSVTKPLQGRGRVRSEVTVSRPLLSSEKGIVLSQGLLPWYSDLDTYAMAAASIDNAVRAAVAAGADPDNLALLDNFCWCSANDPERLYELKRAAQACYDTATIYGTPFISGKDSMFNDFKGFDAEGNRLKISVPPTLLISAIGVIPDVDKAVTLDAKCAGDIVYVLGNTLNEAGASEYAEVMGIKFGGRVPKVNARKNIKRYRLLAQAIKQGLIASATNVSRGGLLVALAKTAMGGNLGMNLSFKNWRAGKMRPDLALFSESQGRVVLTANPKNSKILERLFAGQGLAQLGLATEEARLRISDRKGGELLNLTIASLLQAYRKTFKDY